MINRVLIRGFKSIGVIGIVLFLLWKLLFDGAINTEEELDISLWTVYWDSENLSQEVEISKEYIDNLSFFAAYFDSEDKLFIPEAITRAHVSNNTAHSKRGWNEYLTIVNDQIQEDGSSSLKDVQLLERLLGDEISMQAHIEEVIELVLDGGYEGIEIDYEAIRKDKELWERFLIFCEKLYSETYENNLKLRIVLEPGAPMDTVVFPNGPEYVVMCYNLYGYGTMPGPKADREFLEQLVDKAKGLPGEKIFTLSTGGFKWSESGVSEAITEHQAKNLLEATAVDTERDDSSQCVYYEYQDSKGDTYSVWYADEQTLRHWINILREQGVKQVGIWRIGG